MCTQVNVVLVKLAFVLQVKIRFQYSIVHKLSSSVEGLKKGH